MTLPRFMLMLPGLLIGAYIAFSNLRWFISVINEEQISKDVLRRRRKHYNLAIMVLLAYVVLSFFIFYKFNSLFHK